MASDLIHAGTTIGSVHLTVQDLDRQIAYYEQRIGFRVHDRREGVARLGTGGPDLLVLWENARMTRPRGTTGLYHFAVLLPSRQWLALALAHLRDTRTTIVGASDHLVSEALYLEDPDGNGIEIYRDRPRDEWPREGSGYRLATLPLDIAGLLAEISGPNPWKGLPPETRIGHIHLHVRGIPESEGFYVGAMGFQETGRLGSTALFLAAGGYHHHIGINTWNGVGASAPPRDALGLRRFVIRVPDDDEAHRVAGRIRDAGGLIEETNAGFETADPSGNRILLTGARQS